MNVYEKVPPSLRVWIFAQGLFHLLLSVFIVSTVWLMANNRDFTTLATWHVFLSTMGFALCMAESSALLNPGNEFFIGVNKPLRGWIHGVLMVLSGVMVIAGVSIKIQDKVNRSSSHLVTPHAIVGFTAFVITIVSLILGILVAKSKDLYNKFHLKPAYFRSLHICLGVSAYILGITSLCLGLKNYFGEASDNVKIGLIVILALQTGLNVIHPIKNLLRL